MILLNRIRLLFLGWKRFADLLQTCFFILLASLLISLLVQEVMYQPRGGGGRSTEFFYGMALVMLFFLNYKKLTVARWVALIAIVWTTLLWFDLLLPGAIDGPIGILSFKSIGDESLCLSAFSAISLFGLGYPFFWMGKSRIGLMIIVGLGVSLIGFLLLSKIVVFERTIDFSHFLSLCAASLFLIIFGAVILVKGIQDCLDEGTGYWPQIPYAAASVMFLLTTVLWSAFHIHEQQIWTREVESYTVKIGDRLGQKFHDLSLELERFNRWTFYREGKLALEWQKEARIFLDHEKAVFFIDYFPRSSLEGKMERSKEGNSFNRISYQQIDSAAQKSMLNHSPWMTDPFIIQEGRYGIGFVSVSHSPGQPISGFLMGVEFEPLFNDLIDNENIPIDFQLKCGSLTLRDFEEKGSFTDKNQFITEIYLYGTRFTIHAVPKKLFFQKRDQYLSFCFFVAGLSFSLLFGILIGLYIHLHHDSLELREINDRLGFEIEERRSAEREGDQKNRDLETLIYVVAHDLREPLRGIESFSRLIYERYLDRLDEKGQDFLRRIVFSSMRLDRLLDDIAMLSRVQRAEPPTAPIPGRELVMEALSRLEAVSKAKNANISVERDIPSLWVNRTWGTQAIFNLIGNALKFTNPHQEPEILVKAYRSENGEQEGVQILDRGPGVKAEHVERIFKLFQRAVGRDIEGTGAGLAIVKQIAERHGGTVYYENREGGGSCFTLTFAKRDRSVIPESEEG